MTNEEIKESLDYIATMACDIWCILKYDYEADFKSTEMEYCSKIESETNKLIKALEAQPMSVQVNLSEEYMQKAVAKAAEKIKAEFKTQPCEDAMFFKIIKDIEESDEQQVSYNEEFQLSKYAYVINNAETFKEMGYQVINEESVFGFDTVYLKRNKKVDDLPPRTPQRPKGEWIHREDMDYLDKNKVMHIHFMCQDCGFIHDFIDGHTTQYKYCPKCGAEMEVNADE